MKLAVVVMVCGMLGCHEEPPPAQPAPPPPPPTCVAVAAHVRDVVQASHGSEHVDVVAAIATATKDHCAADAWSGDVRACLVRAKDLPAGHQCLDQLPPAQRDAFLAAVTAVTAPPATAAAAAPPGMPAACVAYKALMDQYFACPKIPPAARDAAKTAFDAAWQQWADMPAEGMAELGSACETAADAAKAMVCPQ